MTDRRSRLVVAAIATLLLAVLGFWLWRSAPPAVPGVVLQEAEAPTAAMRTASAAPPERVTVASESSEPLRVTVRRTPSIEGSVVDEQGQPVAGVHLRAELHRSGGMASAWSREDGSFVIHAVDADPRPVRLRIIDPGPCEPSWSDDRPWEWGSREVRIVLKRALSFELTVVERGTGTPVTRYAVSCYQGEPNHAALKDFRLGGEHASGRVTVDRVRRGTNALYVLPVELDLQPSARIEFEITDAGIAPMRVEVERLRRGIVRAVTGRGEPAVGSKVEVVVKGTEPFAAASEVQASRGGRVHSFDPGHRFHELTGTGVTGADGRAEVFVSPTALGVVVRVTGPHPPLIVDPAVFTPGQDLVVVVPEGGGIVGRVLLRGLDPTRVVLHVERTDGEELQHRRLEKATMQADGRFALRGLAPGGYRLRLSYAIPFRTEHGSTAGSSSLAVNVPDVTVVAERNTTTEIDATDHVPASLRGRVLLAGIVPSPARVYLRAAGGAHAGQFVPDVYGVFEATGLLPGTYRAWLVVGDFRMGEGDRIAAEDTFTLAAGEHLVRDFTFKR